MAVKDYNVDPDLNTAISGINIAEGCPPSGINNAIRQLMADVKEESDAQGQDISDIDAALEALRALIAEEVAKCLKASGGAMTGELLSSVSNEGQTNFGGATKEQIVVLSAGPDGIYGAPSLTFFPYNHASYPGYVRIRANNQVRGYDLWLKTDGTASWNGNDILTSAGGTLTGKDIVVMAPGGTTFVLPAGGTWRYLCVRTEGDANKAIIGQAAGGTTVNFGHQSPVVIAIRVA